MADAIESGQKLQLPGISFTPRTLPAKEAEGDKPYRPERKVALIRVKKSKKKSKSGDSIA